MEIVKNLLEARSALEKAASDFLEACTTLKLVTIPSLASATGQMAFEKNIDKILSGADSASLVANYMFKSRTILNKLLNLSTSRVPINNLPAETLSHIFTLVAAASPCNPVDTQRDTLLDIPQVCTKWNQVARSTPSLWSHIDINLSRSTIPAALGRAQIWLDRCHNMPIHLHLMGDYGRVTQPHIPEILVAVQSQGGQLSSLLVSKSRHYSLIHALLGSAPGHGLSSSLKTLFLSGVHEIDSRGNVSSLPMSSLRELLVLDLFDLSGSTCPSIDGLAELLSSCSTLHTIRLRYLEPLPGSLQTYTTIPLPRLRLLEISKCDVLPLLSKIAPGVLELDLRLDAEYIGDDQHNSPGQALLARSNVVSLLINRLEDFDQQPTIATYLASVPRLRVLQIDSFSLARDFAVMLETTVDDQLPVQLPYLQSLCLVDWVVDYRAVDLIMRILRQRKLRKLAFLACNYPPSFSQPIDVGEENGLPSNHDDDNSELDTQIYQKQMPRSMRDWFSARVGSVVLCEEINREGFYHGVDPFVQGLIRPV